MDIEDDIGADVKAAIAEHAESPAVEQKVADAVEKPAVKVDDAGRAHGADGKFIRKEEEAAPAAVAAEEKPEANVKASDPKAQEAVPAAVEQPKAIQPPKAWSPEAKAAFLEAPVTIQQAMLKRHEEMEEGQKQWSTKAESFNRLDKVIAPHREKWALNGVSEDVAIAQLLAAQNMLETRPAEAIAYLARSYNVDLRRLVAPSQGQQPVNGQPPNGALPDIGQHPLVQQLATQVQTLTQTLTQREQAEANAHREATLSEIEKFASDPEHIYFENVRAKVAALLRADGLEGTATPPQERLKAAYDEACWATPSVRALMQAAAEKKAAGAARAKDARNASGSVAGAPGPGKSVRTGGSNDDLEDDIRSAMREAASA